MRFMQLTSSKKCNYNNKALPLSIHKKARYRHLYQVNVSLNWRHSTGFILVYTTASDRRGKPSVCCHVVTNWLVMLPMVIFCWKYPGPFWCAVWCSFAITQFQLPKACIDTLRVPSETGGTAGPWHPALCWMSWRVFVGQFPNPESSSRAPGRLLHSGELSLGLGVLGSIMPLLLAWRVKVQAFAP